MKKLLFFVIVTLIVSSCDPNRVSEKSKDIDVYWLADSTVSFSLDIPNSDIDYNVLFYIRNGVNFPHANLYFKYSLKDSVGSTIESELINMQLFHAKSGYPLGNGVGDLFEHQYEILTKYRFAKPGRYHLNFNQYMRYDSLPEIYSVGYRVEKTTNP